MFIFLHSTILNIKKESLKEKWGNSHNQNSLCFGGPYITKLALI